MRDRCEYIPVRCLGGVRAPDAPAHPIPPPGHGYIDCHLRQRQSRQSVIKKETNSVQPTQARKTNVSVLPALNYSTSRTLMPKEKIAARISLTEADWWLGRASAPWTAPPQRTRTCPQRSAQPPVGRSEAYPTTFFFVHKKTRPRPGFLEIES